VTRNDFAYVTYASNEDPEALSFVLGRRVKGNGVPSFEVALSFRSARDLAVASGRLFLTGDGHTAALDALTGAPVWQSATGSKLFGPVVSQGRVLLQTATELIALEETTGAVLWRTPLPAAPTGDMSVTSERILVPSATATGVRLSAFSLANGGSLFTTTIGTGQLSGNLAVGGDVLWLGENDGLLYAASIANGATLASFDLSQGGQFKLIGNPIVANGHVYVSNTKAVFALGLEPPPNL
jgi:outer membrane protein assembly factor BamB